MTERSPDGDVPDQYEGFDELAEFEDVDPALASAVLEVERHVAEDGWDGPARLFALVDTASIIEHEPELAAELGLDDAAEEGSFTVVDQEALPPNLELEEVLVEVVWPAEVAGCAAVVERLVLPPEVEDEIPEDPAAATEFAANHPLRQEVRIVAGATRSGATYCALRMRSHDADDSVVGGTDLVPGLLELVQGTLIDGPDSEDQS